MCIRDRYQRRVHGVKIQAEVFWGNYSGYWPLRKSVNPEKFNDSYIPYFNDSMIDEVSENPELTTSKVLRNDFYQDLILYGFVNKLKQINSEDLQAYSLIRKVQGIPNHEIISRYEKFYLIVEGCLLYTSPSPRDS
eukprot:TRINITY_DN9951_c0_g1_i2.p1 TRINITY_DN9951_c0_g1~~TRINITY_DN9951_c0_g1_i2.p1  ORF type:complete len:156 (+),score=31.84 TRINITY_DN9951_c0_g1_i2:62-469(+)